jgi:hypothetical protein
MNNSAILEIFYEYEYVTYYTIRSLTSDGEPENLSETDKFYDKYDNPEDTNFDEFEVIVDIIDAIGYHKKGAEDCLFRFEDAAHALPSKRGYAKRVLEIEVIEDSGLRLYCIRLTNRVVILLNGGVKTTDTALTCPNVKQYFIMAQLVAKVIDSMFSERSIMINGGQIVNKTGEDNIILHL